MPSQTLKIVRTEAEQSAIPRTTQTCLGSDAEKPGFPSSEIHWTWSGSSDLH